MEIISGHRRQRSSLHVVRCLAHSSHLRRLVLESVQKPNEIAVADEGIAIQTKSRHGSHVLKSVRWHMVEQVVLQEQPVEGRQIVERALLYLPQAVVGQVELLQLWQAREGIR